jgi:hypothetical protein
MAAAAVSDDGALSAVLSAVVSEDEAAKDASAAPVDASAAPVDASAAPAVVHSAAADDEANEAADGAASEDEAASDGGGWHGTAAACAGSGEVPLPPTDTVPSSSWRGDAAEDPW